MKTNKNYMFKGVQVVIFFYDDDAKKLGLNIIETDAFGHAAVKYDDVKDRDDVDEEMLYTPLYDAEEGEEIIISYDAMDVDYEGPDCRFCTKEWAKECHAYFEFSFNQGEPYKGSQLAQLIKDINYYADRNDYRTLDEKRSSYDAEMGKHYGDVTVGDAMVSFDEAFEKTIQNYEEWKNEAMEFEKWWDAGESVKGDDEQRAYELADSAIEGDDPGAPLDYSWIRQQKKQNTEAQLKAICKNNVEVAALHTDSEAIKAYAAQIVYNRIYA